MINCAAWTDVDGAEASEHDAELVNGEGASFVATAAANVGAKVLYVSTDYVFDGAKRGAYTESDEPDPINAYGRTKLAGERATALATKRSFIVRTSWLFGPGGGNFVETMLRLGQGGGPVVVVHDQVGCPTYTGHLAAGLVRLLDTESFGIHHMAGQGQLLLVRVRDGDLPPVRGRHPGHGLDLGHDGPRREAAGQLGPRQRANRADHPPGLETGPRRLPGPPRSPDDTGTGPSPPGRIEHVPPTGSGPAQGRAEPDPENEEEATDVEDESERGDGE